MLPLRLDRASVLWLLLCITWGLFRGLAETDGDLVVHLIRDLGGVGMRAFPIAFVVAHAVGLFDAELVSSNAP